MEGKKRAFTLLLHVAELPRALRVARRQWQSSSHVQLPPQQHKHFAVRQRSSHPSRQRSRRGHGYVSAVTVQIPTQND